MSEPYFQSLLNNKLTERCRKNPRYSLRAFATSLGIHASTLSRTLNGEARIGIKGAAKISRQLGLSPRENDLFLTSLKLSKKNPNLDKTNAHFKPATLLSQDLFQIVADPIHFAILELTFVKGFSSDPKWIAKKLNVPLIRAKMAIKNLLKLGLLKTNETGRLEKNVNRLLNNFGTDFSSSGAQRSYQRHNLKKALVALDEVAAAKRIMTAMAIPTNPEKLALAKIMIETFAQKVCDTLAAGEMTEVYQLQISLFPFNLGGMKE